LPHRPPVAQFFHSFHGKTKIKETDGSGTPSGGCSSPQQQQQQPASWFNDAISTRNEIQISGQNKFQSGAVKICKFYCFGIKMSTGVACTTTNQILFALDSNFGSFGTLGRTLKR